MLSRRALPRLAYSSDEFARVRLGLKPQAMEDKWFAFAEFEGGVERVRFHRSWTGLCIYEADFAAHGDEFELIRLAINRDPDQYRETDDAFDAALFAYLVETLLLGRPSTPPRRGDESGTSYALRSWSFAGRATTEPPHKRSG